MVEKTYEELQAEVTQLRQSNEDGYIVVHRLLEQVKALESRIERQKEFMAAQCMGEPD